MMATMQDALRGRCLCGAVRFTVTPPTDFASHCHCESCRRAHAAPFVTWTSVPEARCALLDGAAAVRTYASSPGVLRSFCGTCGTPLFFRGDDAPGRTYVPVATLVDPLDRPIKGHVSYEEHVAWLEGVEQLPCTRGKTGHRVPWIEGGG